MDPTEIGGLIGGGAAVGASGLTGLVSYGIAKLSRKDRDRDREQERLFEAYTTIMTFVANRGAWVAWKLQQITVSTQPVLTGPQVSDELSERDQARASLVGSAKVGELLDKFGRKLAAIPAQVGTYEAALKRKEMGDKLSYRVLDPGAIPELERAGAALAGTCREAIRLADELTDQMRSELGAHGKLPATPL